MLEMVTLWFSTRGSLKGILIFQTSELRLQFLSLAGTHFDQQGYKPCICSIPLCVVSPNLKAQGTHLFCLILKEQELLHHSLTTHFRRNGSLKEGIKFELRLANLLGQLLPFLSSCARDDGEILGGSGHSAQNPHWERAYPGKSSASTHDEIPSAEKVTGRFTGVMFIEVVR